MKIKVSVFKMWYNFAEVIENYLVRSNPITGAGVMAGTVFIDDRIFGRATVKWDLTGELQWVEGTSTSGNYARVETRPDENHLIFTFVGARHALRDTGNEAGLLFASVFSPREDGVWTRKLDLEALESASIMEYESWRTDAPWWECGLAPEPPSEKFSEFDGVTGWRAGQAL